jgi:imidazolonepropionase
VYFRFKQIGQLSAAKLRDMANSQLIENIQQLVLGGNPAASRLAGLDLKAMQTIENAWLLIENGIIKDFGSMANALFAQLSQRPDVEKFDATGKLVLPGFVDSHTHLVFAGTREKEFTKRLSGISYQQIADEGGGILFSVKNVRAASQDELFDAAWTRLKEVINTGTVAIEIKSGYGLSFQDEVKMLEVVKQLKQKSPIPVKATLLAAHAFPPEFASNRQGYIDMINQKLIPYVAKNELAEAVDVFCETGYFTEAETDSILNAALNYGLSTKVHAHQFNRSGGVRAGVKAGALSVDHLECINQEDMELLYHSETIPTLLPGAAFFLQLPLPPARAMADAGLPLAVASDYNPGSSPSGNMPLMVALACVEMKLTPAEALNAATQNSAAALGIGAEYGNIAVGKRGSLIITTPLENYEQIPYFFGKRIVERVIVNGKNISDNL